VIFFSGYQQDYYGNNCDCADGYFERWIMDEWIFATATLIWEGGNGVDTEDVISKVYDKVRTGVHWNKGWRKTICDINNSNGRSQWVEGSGCKNFTHFASQSCKAAD